MSSDSSRNVKEAAHSVKDKVKEEMHHIKDDMHKIVGTRVPDALDPAPQYLMAGACVAAAAYSYFTLLNPQASMVAGAVAAGYYAAGYYITRGEPGTGYSVGSVASLALLAMVGPKAYNAGEAYSVAMSSMAAITGAGNLLKAYQYNSRENDLNGRVRPNR